MNTWRGPFFGHRQEGSSFPKQARMGKWAQIPPFPGNRKKLRIAPNGPILGTWPGRVSGRCRDGAETQVDIGMTPANLSEAKPDEISLVRRVAQGEEAALATLYRTYFKDLLRFVYRRVGENYEDAEEITQDVFLLAVARAHTYQGRGPVLRWLYGIAKNRISDFYRQQGREKRIPPEKMVSWDEETLRAFQEWEREISTEEEVIDRLDGARLVDVMMASLTEDEREALLLRYVEDLSVREVAVLMERTEKAIDSLVTRAKKKAAQATTVASRKG